MKKTILKLGKIITSRMFYLFIGLFIAVTVLVARAAYHDTVYPGGLRVEDGASLTPDLWNS